MIETIFHGHSFVEITYEGKSILIDPYITGNKLCDITLENCIEKNISAIVITTDHPDHRGDYQEILKSSSCRLFLNYEMTNSEEQSSNEFSIRSVNKGILLTVAGKSIYHAGITKNIDDCKTLMDLVIDCGFLPIGGQNTLTWKEAVSVTKLISPGYVVPIHYNTGTTIKIDPIDFAREVLLGNYAVPKVLTLGQMIVLD